MQLWLLCIYRMSSAHMVEQSGVWQMNTAAVKQPITAGGFSSSIEDVKQIFLKMPSVHPSFLGGFCEFLADLELLIFWPLKKDFIELLFSFFGGADLQTC